ncbi:MAG: HD domain-containing phosphohydrolase [Acidobacteriota bacterium]
MKHKILFVDDEHANLRVLERLFRDAYDVMTAGSGSEALELLSEYEFALIISDQRMPVMTGIEFLKRAAELRPHTVRIILTGYTDVSELVEAINSGVVYKYITKPWSNQDLILTVQRGVEHYETGKNGQLLIGENARLRSRLGVTVRGFVYGIVETLGLKNSELAEHCRRTAVVAGRIGEKMGLAPHQLEKLNYAALLHEMPNMRLPFDLLLNKASLTPAQLNSTQISYDKGLRMFASVPDLEDVVTILSNQHEHFDGTGYFNGLDLDLIPLTSRILAVANAFDELNSGRYIHREARSDDMANELRKRAGSQLDPQLVEICLATLPPEKPAEQSGNVLVPDMSMLMPASEHRSAREPFR